MDLNQIKQSVNQGSKVYWGDSGYQVIVDSLGQYFIKCLFNGRVSELVDSQFSEYKETDFFIKD